MDASGSLIPISTMLDLLALVPSPHDDSPLDVDVDGARLARELKNARLTRIGMLPADRVVDVMVLARTLGRALSVLTETNVLVVDLERKLSDAPGRDEQQIYGCAMDAGVGGVCLGKAPGPGEKAMAIRRILDFANDPPECCGRVLVDLSACTRPGELLGALDLLDGVIIVGQSGRTTERALSRASRRVPTAQNLGVLLVE